MFFYCTTKIRNYYKVGVASSLDRIKKRLTTYRTSNPNLKIKFFSEIDGLDQDLEWSFKNKLPHIKCKLKTLLSNPFFRSIALRGLFRIVRFLIFRR